MSPRGNRSRLRIPDLSRRIIEDLDARNKDEPKLSPISKIHKANTVTEGHSQNLYRDFKEPVLSRDVA